MHHLNIDPLSDWLRLHQFQQHAGDLRALGVESVADLALVTADYLAKLGWLPIPVRRFLRALADASGGGDVALAEPAAGAVDRDPPEGSEVAPFKDFPPYPMPNT